MTRITHTLMMTTVLFAVAHASAALVDLNLTGSGISGTLRIDTATLPDSDASSARGEFVDAFDVISLTIGADSFAGPLSPFLPGPTVVIEDNPMFYDTLKFIVNGGTLGGNNIDGFELTFEPPASTFSSDSLTQLDSLDLSGLYTGYLVIKRGSEGLDNLEFDVEVDASSTTSVPVPGALLLGLLGVAALSLRRR